MKISKWFYLSVLLPFSVTAAELPAPAAEVQIFRNGTALIRHQVNAGSAADFTVSGNFSPLEGTIWCSPNVKEIRKTISEISKEEAVPLSDITETYKNQFVTLYVNSGINKLETVKGTVIDLNKKEKNANSPYVRNSYVTLKCTKEGKIVRLCSLCEREDVEKLEMIDHLFEEVENTHPSCTGSGKIKKKCSVCGSEDI